MFIQYVSVNIPGLIYRRNMLQKGIVACSFVAVGLISLPCFAETPFFTPTQVENELSHGSFMDRELFLKDVGVTVPVFQGLNSNTERSNKFSGSRVELGSSGNLERNPNCANNSHNSDGISNDVFVCHIFWAFVFLWLLVVLAYCQFMWLRYISAAAEIGVYFKGKHIFEVEAFYDVRPSDKS